MVVINDIIFILSSSTSGPNINGVPSITSVSCTGDEKYFIACSYVFGITCSSSGLAGVSCVADTGEYTEGIYNYSILAGAYLGVQLHPFSPHLINIHYYHKLHTHVM